MEARRTFRRISYSGGNHQGRFGASSTQFQRNGEDCSNCRTIAGVEVQFPLIRFLVMDERLREAGKRQALAGEQSVRHEPPRVDCALCPALGEGVEGGGRARARTGGPVCRGRRPQRAARAASLLRPRALAGRPPEARVALCLHSAGGGHPDPLHRLCGRLPE
eukprot:jgi/Mesen1/4861/ME000244S04045